MSTIERRLREEAGQADALLDRWRQDVSDGLIPVHGADEFGVTVLMIAADAGHHIAVKVLCESGAALNAVSETGETALINAVRGRAGESDPSGRLLRARLKILEELAASGAELDQLGYQGCSALHWSIILSDVELVRHLLDLGSRVDVQLDDPPDSMDALELARSARCQGPPSRQLEVVAALQARAHRQ